MKRLTIVKVIWFVASLSIVPFGWYLSGIPFPTHRGYALLVLVSETLVVGIAGYYEFHLLFWDFYWKEKNK